MSAYWLWFPTLQPGTPPRVTLFASWRESFYLANGSAGFVQTALADLGVVEAVRRWQLQLYRARYFAPDPHDTNWDDLWHPIWKLEVELSVPPHALDVLSRDGRRETDASDETWSPANDPVIRSPWRCLEVGDFLEPSVRAAARAEIAAALPTAVLSEGYAFGRPQLHVDLGARDAAWYEVGGTEAEVTRAIMRSHGAATDFERALANATSS